LGGEWALKYIEPALDTLDRSTFLRQTADWVDRLYGDILLRMAERDEARGLYREMVAGACGSTRIRELEALYPWLKEQ
jgi:hypothetical protein